MVPQIEARETYWQQVVTGFHNIGFYALQINKLFIRRLINLSGIKRMPLKQMSFLIRERKKFGVWGLGLGVRKTLWLKLFYHQYSILNTQFQLPVVGIGLIIDY